MVWGKKKRKEKIAGKKGESSDDKGCRTPEKKEKDRSCPLWGKVKISYREETLMTSRAWGGKRQGPGVLEKKKKVRGRWGQGQEKGKEQRGWKKEKVTLRGRGRRERVFLKTGGGPQGKECVSVKTRGQKGSRMIKKKENNTHLSRQKLRLNEKKGKRSRRGGGHFNLGVNRGERKVYFLQESSGLVKKTLWHLRAKGRTKRSAMHEEKKKGEQWTKASKKKKHRKLCFPTFRKMTSVHHWKKMGNETSKKKRKGGSKLNALFLCPEVPKGPLPKGGEGGEIHVKR